MQNDQKFDSKKENVLRETTLEQHIKNAPCETEELRVQMLRARRT